ncbi:MAG TPA: hypothetical protein PLD73_17735 [Candidatus Hydrogenedentes bacterium]|jgi:hypothetical protein|nr:hypothetical protein [Candidatus Hydrogenedentota bacterium]
MHERNGIKRHQQNGNAIAKKPTALFTNECHRNSINRVMKTVYPNFILIYPIVNTSNRAI